jgi:hypothetical protein
MLSSPAKNKIDLSNTRRVLLEFNKGLNIKTCQSWLQNYTGEVIRVPYYGHGFTTWKTKKPTLSYNGFKTVYSSVWGEVAKWSNKDIVVYVMSKHHIDKKSEVLYHIGKLDSSRNKSVQLFYRKSVTN